MVSILILVCVLGFWLNLITDSKSSTDMNTRVRLFRNRSFMVGSYVILNRVSPSLLAFYAWVNNINKLISYILRISTCTG